MTSTKSIGSNNPNPQIWAADSQIALRSTLMQDNYIKVTSGMSASNGAGGGTVECANLVPTSATLPAEFLFTPHYGLDANGYGVFSFESVKYPKCYLRLNGLFTQQPPKPPVGPVLDLQYWDTPPDPTKTNLYELFVVGRAPGSPFGEYSIQSKMFKHAYVAFDKTTTPPAVRGGYANNPGAIITGWYN
jgi:hypothetical protein